MSARVTATKVRIPREAWKVLVEEQLRKHGVAFENF